MELSDQIHKLILKTFKTSKAGYCWVVAHFNGLAPHNAPLDIQQQMFDCLTSKKNQTECPVHFRIHAKPKKRKK